MTPKHPVNDPAAHEAHESPLADRIIEQAIREWLNTATAITLAANGNPPINDYERGVAQGVEQMRHLHLDNYWYALVPKITDQLRRAGLLSPNEVEFDDT
jgi:hypothetical protein